MHLHIRLLVGHGDGESTLPASAHVRPDIGQAHFQDVDRFRLCKILSRRGRGEGGGVRGEEEG